jgi:hypothetical protein
LFRWFVAAATVALFLIVGVPGLAQTIELRGVDYANAAARNLRSFNEAVHIQTALNANQFEEALANAKTLVARNDVAGHYWFAYIHREGKGVERNIDVALKHFRIADELGASAASQTLFLMYSKGDDVEKNLQLARLYRERALLSSSSVSTERARAFAPSWAGYKPGDEPLHAIWTEHAKFLRNLWKVEKLQYEKLRNESDALSSEPVHANTKVPDSCRPSAIPRREMLSTRTDEFSGAIQLVVDESGKSDGMHILRVGDRDLTLGAFWIFFKALATSKCVFPSEHRNAVVEIPFTFKFQ